MTQVMISDKKRKKLEKKKQKQKEKRRKRINAMVDRTLAVLVIGIYVVFSVLEVKDYLEKQEK